MPHTILLLFLEPNFVFDDSPSSSIASAILLRPRSPWALPLEVVTRGKLKLGDGEVSKRAIAYRLAYPGHQTQVVRDIVQGIEV